MVATIAVFVVEGSRRSEAEARKEAETNFNMAQEAVEEYLTNVSENTLLKEQDSLDIRTLRQELLTTALRYYEKFVSQRSNDPRLREKLARAFFRVGEITQVVGPARDALSAFQSAVEIWEPLVAANPDNLEFKARLADSYVAISKLKKIDSLQEALSWLQLARQIREDLTFHKPLDAGFSASLAECYSEIGDCNATLDQTYESPRDSSRWLETARKIWSPDFPTRSATRRASRRSSTASGSSTIKGRTTPRHCGLTASSRSYAWSCSSR